MSLEINHFKSDGKTVTMVNSGAIWEGYQAEIDFFAFHAERFARLVESEAIPTVVYQESGNIYGFRKQAGGCHGAFASRGDSGLPIVLQEVMEDLN